VGSWVNLGAGTSCSNLKNTYGNVKCQMSNVKSDKIDTGMQFLGCVIGDYVKAAINTSIYTGKIIGVYAQLFGRVTENVGSFVIWNDGKREEFELDAAIRCQKRVFERRGITQSQNDIEMLRRVFKETREERNYDFIYQHNLVRQIRS
jgi:glucose-1-phosphate thymidylyltransferase